MQPKELSLKQKKVISVICNVAIICFFCFIIVEVDLHELRSQIASDEIVSEPKLSISFQGSGLGFIKESRLYEGSLVIYFYDPANDSASIQRITLQKYRNEQLISARTIYSPRVNVLYAVLNKENGIFRTVPIVCRVSSESIISYKVCVETKTGQYCRQEIFSYNEGVPYAQ